MRFAENVFLKLMTRYFFACSFVSTLILSSPAGRANEETAVMDSLSYPDLPPLMINGRETANLRPVTTYESPISNLDFDPRVDMQSRNMAEAQGDVSIRGGIFENTGFQVGAATILDPQTGHYTTELPIAPEMLGEPQVRTGTDNALGGFNSAVGTIGYSWRRMTRGGSITIGGGENSLNFQRLHNAWTQPLGNSEDWTIGYEGEYSRSESDGAVQFGDHNFYRGSGRIQLLGPDSQTDFFAGYQSKFFGLYGMYTGNQYTAFNPYETENIKTRLFILNHTNFYSERSFWEATAYHRRNGDHYIFNRFSPNNNFIHETGVSSIGLAGLHAYGKQFALRYALQITGDDIESSTLEEGKFTSRSYSKLSILPQYQIELENRQSVTIEAGATLDETNRDGSKISPLAEVSWRMEDGEGNFDRLHLSYAQSTQLVGYGAIGGSETSGLFRSNHDLSREISKNIELGYTLDRTVWSLDGAFFYRWDNNLVDWTFTGAGARAAENVDIETFGFEIVGSHRWDRVEAIASYGYLEKKEDYGNTAVDGSFYALNFPENRLTLSLNWNPNDLFEIRIDNEWRDQHENSLRTGPDQSTYSHLAASFFPAQIEDLELFIALDKPWDKEFQDIPGTPGRGDQFSLGASYRW